MLKQLKLIEGEQRDAAIKEFYRTKEEIPGLHSKCVVAELSTTLLSAQEHSKGRFFASLVQTIWKWIQLFFCQVFCYKIPVLQSLA